MATPDAVSLADAAAVRLPVAAGAGRGTRADDGLHCRVAVPGLPAGDPAPRLGQRPCLRRGPASRPCRSRPWRPTLRPVGAPQAEPLVPATRPRAADREPPGGRDGRLDRDGRPLQRAGVVPGPRLVEAVRRRRRGDPRGQLLRLWRGDFAAQHAPPAGPLPTVRVARRGLRDAVGPPALRGAGGARGLPGCVHGSPAVRGGVRVRRSLPAPLRSLAATPCGLPGPSARRPPAPTSSACRRCRCSQA